METNVFLVMKKVFAGIPFPIAAYSNIEEAEKHNKSLGHNEEMESRGSILTLVIKNTFDE